MSHKEQYCECSMPNSTKRCRVDCGLPKIPDSVRSAILRYEPLALRDFTEEEMEEIRKMQSAMTPNPLEPRDPLTGHILKDVFGSDDELEPMLNDDGTPMTIFGLPVMVKKEQKP